MSIKKDPGILRAMADYPDFGPVNNRQQTASRYTQMGDLCTVRVYAQQANGYATMYVRFGAPAMARLGLEKGQRFHLLVKQDAKGEPEAVLLVPADPRTRRALTLDARPGAKASAISTSTKLPMFGPYYGYPTKDESGRVLVAITRPD